MSSLVSRRTPRLYADRAPARPLAQWSATAVFGSLMPATRESRRRILPVRVRGHAYCCAVCETPRILAVRGASRSRPPGAARDHAGGARRETGASGAGVRRRAGRICVLRDARSAVEQRRAGPQASLQLRRRRASTRPPARRRQLTSTTHRSLGRRGRRRDRATPPTCDARRRWRTRTAAGRRPGGIHSSAAIRTSLPPPANCAASSSMVAQGCSDSSSAGRAVERADGRHAVSTSPGPSASTRTRRPAQRGTARPREVVSARGRRP